MSIRGNTVHYEKYEGYDLNYFKHDDKFCVYIGDILQVLGAVTKRGNYADVAYKNLRAGIDFFEFKLGEGSWNRVYLTAEGVKRIYGALKLQMGDSLSKKIGIISHCVGTLEGLADGTVEPVAIASSIKKDKKKEEKVTADFEDSYAVDLLEDIDARLASVERAVGQVIKGIQRDMLLLATHDLHSAQRNVMTRSVLVGTLQCLVDCQIQNPLSKNKDLKERLRRASTLLSKEYKLLDQEDERIEERRNQIEDYKRAINYKGNKDGLEEEDAEPEAEDTE